MSKNILITGAAGFIGQHVARHLLETDSGCSLYLLDNMDRGQMDAELTELAESPRVQFFKRDLNQPDAYEGLPQIDTIYHFAAVIGVKNVLNHPDRVLRTNALTMFHLYDFAKTQKNLKNILFSSTSEVYAGTLKHFNMEIPTPETTPLALMGVDDNRNTYSLSKMYGESLALMENKVHGIPSTIVRYHNIYGPRMGFMHVVPELMYRMKNNERVEVFSPNHTRAFCFVQDAVRATVMLAEQQKAIGKIYNIGNSDQEIKMMELAQKIKNITRSSVELVEGEENQSSPQRRCPSIEKLKSEFQFQNEYDLDRGIEKTWNWYKDRLGERYE